MDSKGANGGQSGPVTSEPEGQVSFWDFI